MQSIGRSCVLVLSLSLLLFFSLCTIGKASENEAAKSKPSSTLVEGTWAVDGNTKITIMGRHHHFVEFFDTTENWTFDPDGTFTALDQDTGVTINGSWREKGKNVTVSFNRGEYQTLLEEALAADGLFTIITITKLTATGTVGPNTIRGKLTVNARIYQTDTGKSGTMTATALFAGARTTPDAVVNAGPESESLIAAISKLIGKGLSLPEE